MLESMKATDDEYIYHRYTALESLHCICVHSFSCWTHLQSAHTHFCAELKVFKGLIIILDILFLRSKVTGFQLSYSVMKH